jgi:shikimate dehydrogenase
MSYTNKFKLAGVMGMPIYQSRSPILHNYWLTKYGIQGAYGHFPVELHNLEAAIRGLSALGLAGCNITLPHKVQAMKMMDHIDPLAKRMGAINCIVVQEDGALHGFNHDGYGYIQSVKDAKPDWRADAGPILVLGAGGAARAILLGLVDAGAKEIRLVNRTPSKAQELTSGVESVVKVFNWSERNECMRGAAMLINTTNLGMYGQAPLDVQLDALPMTALVSDAVYIPLETALLEKARLRGNPTVNGLGMLLNQARPAFHSWFGVMPEITQELKEAVLATF